MWQPRVDITRRRLYAVLVGASVIITADAAIAQARTQDTPAGARLQITDAGLRQSIDCAGRAVQITGANNALSFTGACTKIEVTGALNTIDLEAVGRIEVTGAGSHVTWRRGLEGKRPRVSCTGVGSTVQRLPPAADDASVANQEAAGGDRNTDGREVGGATSSVERPRAPREAAGRSAAPPPSPSSGASSASRDGDRVRVLTSNGQDTIDCDNREVTVVGSNNTLTLRGACPLVRVTGSDNTIEADTVGRFLVTGSDNRLTWGRASRGNEPAVTNTGTGNVIRQAAR